MKLALNIILFVIRLPALMLLAIVVIADEIGSEIKAGLVAMWRNRSLLVLPLALSLASCTQFRRDVATVRVGVWACLQATERP